MQKEKMKRAAVIMMAVTMLLPSCSGTPALAEQASAGEKKSIEISVANDGGQMTVTDADGISYTVTEDAKDTLVPVEVGSELTVEVTADSGYEIEDLYSRTDEGDDSFDVAGKTKIKQKIPVTDELTGIRASFAESEAEDEPESVIDYGNTEGTVVLSIGKVTV